MGKVECMLGCVALVAALLQCTAAEKHMVGDTLGWTVPKGPSFTGKEGAAYYTTWANDKKFNVGDILVFNFTTSRHDVAEVSKANFESCSATNSINKPVITGPAEIELKTAGDHYYICTVGKHCELGQKLAVKVSGSSGASAPSMAPTPSKSSVSGSSGAGALSMAPAPSKSSVSGSSGASGLPMAPAPSKSSSSALFTAGFFVTIFSIVMGFFL